MADTYEIQYEGKTAGSVRVEKQGLYHCFHCQCAMPDEKMYRIHVVAGDDREDLGICIPVDGGFGMDKRIPAKRLGEGTPVFELVPKDWIPVKEVIPEPEEIAEPEEITEAVAEELPEPLIETTTAPEEELFIPVSEEEPFPHLDRLEHAVMEVRNDVPGVVIENDMEE